MRNTTNHTNVSQISYKVDVVRSYGQWIFFPPLLTRLDPRAIRLCHVSLDGFYPIFKSRVILKTLLN